LREAQAAGCILDLVRSHRVVWILLLSKPRSEICVLSGDSSIWSCWYSGNAENGVGSVGYRDQTPVSSLSCHIPGGADKGGSTCLRRLGNGDLLRVVADPDFGRTAMRSVGNCCPA